MSIEGKFGNNKISIEAPEQPKILEKEDVLAAREVFTIAKKEANHITIKPSGILLCPFRNQERKKRRKTQSSSNREKRFRTFRTRLKTQGFRRLGWNETMGRDRPGDGSY